MQEIVTKYEIVIRLSSFFGIFALMALLEMLMPRRKWKGSKWPRWINNLGLTFFNSLVVRVVFPGAIAGVASLVELNHWGLMGYLKVDFVFSVILSIIFLDLVIYMQHILVHAVPLLWRLHQVHHADPDYDVTTGSRFHTLEILFSVVVKILAVMAIGAPVVAVIIFEVILNGMAMFNHANFKMPLVIDKVMRYVLVTPDMHRVHHSTKVNEANSNFGFNLAIWDRIFGTYKNQPELGHEEMEIGLKNMNNTKRTVLIFGMLAMPFRKKVSGYAINDKI